MPATVEIHEMSTTGTGTNKTSTTIRYKSANENTVDTTNRIQIPAASTSYSYTKQFRANVAVLPAGELTNLRSYSDGSTGFAAGVGLQYDVSTAFQSQTTVDIAGTDFFSKNASSFIDMDSGATVITSTDSTGYWGSFLRMQMTVNSSASPGTLTAKTLYFSYDES